MAHPSRRREAWVVTASSRAESGKRDENHQRGGGGLGFLLPDLPTSTTGASTQERSSPGPSASTPKGFCPGEEERGHPGHASARSLAVSRLHPKIKGSWPANFIPAYALNSEVFRPGFHTPARGRPPLLTGDGAHRAQLLRRGDNRNQRGKRLARTSAGGWGLKGGSAEPPAHGSKAGCSGNKARWSERRLKALLGVFSGISLFPE